MDHRGQFCSATYHSLCIAMLLTLLSCGGGGSFEDVTEPNSAEVKNDLKIKQDADGLLEIDADGADLVLAAQASACAAPDWRSDAYYAEGSLVRYPGNSRYYKAVRSNPGYNPTISTWYWALTACVQTAAMNVSGFQVSAALYNELFPRKNGFYTYESFARAVASYPNIFRGPTERIRRQQVAAFFANVKQETGGLFYIRETDRSNWSKYCYTNSPYRCVPGKNYYGRGPLQISWNYNYGPAGNALGLNLLEDPDRIVRDPVVAWKTAMWYWTTQKGAGYMTAHRAMASEAGFGHTIRAINGRLECGKPNGSEGRKDMERRSRYYQEFADRLKVHPGYHLTC